MYGKVGSQEVSFESSGSKDPLSYSDLCGRGEAADISGFATVSVTNLAVLIYHHHDDWDAAGEVEIVLEVENLPFQKEVLVTHYRIDREHSNAYVEWGRQGKPIYPTPEQRAAIKAREELETLEPPQRMTPSESKIILKFRLPVHGVSLVSISTGQ